MAFILFSFLTLIIFTLLLNMGRMAFHYVMKMFFTTVFVAVFLLISAYAYWPEETLLVFEKILRTIRSVIEILAE